MSAFESELQRLLDPSVAYSLGYCLSFGLLVLVFFNAVTCTYISVYNVKNPTYSDHAAVVSQSV